MTPAKSIQRIFRYPSFFRVGNGFPVRNLFTFTTCPENTSPFLNLDYAGPVEVPPTMERRGVEEHPHRGFETVTIVYQGELEHRDSAGHHGIIGPGDVQWMTAGAGLVHEEMYSEAFARQGGILQIAQIWVNLPQSLKLSPPRYQTFHGADIPRIELPDGQGDVRVIAGAGFGAIGPAHTHSPINVWDMRLREHASMEIALPEGQTTVLAVLEGEVALEAAGMLTPAQGALLSREGERTVLLSGTDSLVLVLTGTPLNEPVVGFGPFIMNSHDEILAADIDFRGGRMGRLG